MNFFKQQKQFNHEINNEMAQENGNILLFQENFTIYITLCNLEDKRNLICNKILRKARFLNDF